MCDHGLWIEDDAVILLVGQSQSGVKYKGHVEIPNLSDENDPSEVEVRVLIFLNRGSPLISLFLGEFCTAMGLDPCPPH